MSLFADSIEPVTRKKADELFLIRVVAKPSPENNESMEVGGAYVNCWVNVGDLRTAEQQALDKIRSEQWLPTKFEDWEIVCRECYADESRFDETERRESLERVEEAFQYGIALTFHCWPPDAADSNDEDP